MYEAAFRSIDDTLWKDAGCSSELDYIEQTSWVSFLKYLDDFESDKETAALLNGESYTRIIDGEYRWSNWAAPKKPDGSQGLLCEAFGYIRKSKEFHFAALMLKRSLS